MSSTITANTTAPSPIYGEALRLKPDDAQTYMDRGVAYYFKKDYQAAIDDYDQAIKLDPKKSRAYTNRGATYKKLGRNDRAIADESEGDQARSAGAGIFRQSRPVL